MENTKSTKLIAKQNLLKLEANYKFIKKLARMSSNDDNYNAHLSSACQSFLTSAYWAYEKSLRPFENEDYFYTTKVITIDGKNVWAHQCTGSVPTTWSISSIYNVYWNIKHNKLDEIINNPDSSEYAIMIYLMDENTNIKNICK